MASILKTKTTTANKALTVRVPAELHEKINLLRKKAAAKNMRLDISGAVVESLEKLVDKTLKEIEE